MVWAVRYTPLKAVTTKVSVVVGVAAFNCAALGV
jgi:hypothetical protein